MRKITRISLPFAATFFLFSSFAANAVLNMGGKTIFTGTVIEVLEPGPDLQAIITNITDASAAKPYLIHLGPGVYDLGSTNIVMKEWISIQGSGQESTKITGAVSSGDRTATSAVLVGVDNSTLMDLTIENTGGSGQYAIAIYNNSASPRMERVTARVTGSQVIYAVANVFSSSPVMMHVTAEALGAATSGNYGVWNVSFSSPTMTYVIASASGGSVCWGVYNNSSSSPIMTYVTATASGGSGDNIGVLNRENSSPTMTRVVAKGSGGSRFNHGVNTHTSSMFIRDSVLEGSPYGLFLNTFSSGVRVVNSKIIGGVQDSLFPGSTQCRGTYDADLADVIC